MTETPLQSLPPAKRRRLIAWGLLRGMASTTALVALYYLAPIGHIERAPTGVSLTVAMLVLLAVSIWQIGAITRAAYPAVRAIEALAITVPLFLLLFAASYFLLAHDTPSSFNTDVLDRTDALYFTVTVFATVGFGDIVATSQTARLLVTAQMMLDLLALGLGIRVVLGAVERGHQRQAPARSAATQDGS